MAYRRGGIRTSEARLSPVHVLILALLKRKPAHGYMILQGLRERLEGWTIKSGTLYPALHRLVQLELIEGETIEQEERPDAVEYRLTPKGKRVLKEALRGLGLEIRVQDSIWRFLGATFNGEAEEVIMDWAVRERNPMAFVFMRRHCGSKCHGRGHQDFLLRYREYLTHELEWVKERLTELKSSKREERGGEK